jgi:hypothetical protein
MLVQVADQYFNLNHFWKIELQLRPGPEYAPLRRALLYYIDRGGSPNFDSPVTLEGHEAQELWDTLFALGRTGRFVCLVPTNTQLAALRSPPPDYPAA